MGRASALGCRRSITCTAGSRAGWRWWPRSRSSSTRAGRTSPGCARPGRSCGRSRSARSRCRPGTSRSCWLLRAPRRTRMGGCCWRPWRGSRASRCACSRRRTGARPRVRRPCPPTRGWSTGFPTRGPCRAATPSSATPATGRWCARSPAACPWWRARTRGTWPRTRPGCAGPAPGFRCRAASRRRAASGWRCAACWATPRTRGAPRSCATGPSATTGPRSPPTSSSALCSGDAARGTVAGVSHRPSLWIDREDGRDPDAGPFSSARWRRQVLEAEERRRVPEEPEPPAGPPPAARRRLLPILAVAVAVTALALSAAALLDGGGDEADLLATDGGRLAPTQVGRVYESAAPGVVSVQSGPSSGTGFVVNRDGTLITNAHVVGESNTAQVSFGDSGRMVDADVLGTDVSSDLAVLRVDPGSVDRLRPLPLANSDRVRVGDAVVAVGNPFGLDRTATAGIVSAGGPEIPGPHRFPIHPLVPTDAPINPGNSGGPLLDARGRVIGVNTQIATGGTSSGNVGIGFAVPANTVRQVLPALVRGER